MTLHPDEKIIAAVNAWLVALGRPERCAPSTSVNIATICYDHGFDQLPEYLQQLPPPPRGASIWGWLIGCLRTSYEQFSVDHKAQEAHRARALAAAKEARERLAANTCADCGGTGVAGSLAGAEPDLASVRLAVGAGAEICPCDAGGVWREMLG